MADSLIFNPLAWIIAIIFIWAAVRVAGEAWFAAKKAHTDRLLDDMQRSQQGENDDGNE